MPAKKHPQPRKRPPPEPDVAELQDPDQTESDFMRDLDKAADRIGEAKERLARPSERDPESPRR